MRFTNERLKKLRKKCNLSQEEFGKRIGVRKTSISKLESGENNPSEQTIMLICKEFKANENWIRTGEGGDENMFIKAFLEDEYIAYATEIGNGGNEIIKNAIIKYGRLSPKNKQTIDEALEILLNALKEEG